MVQNVALPTSGDWDPVNGISSALCWLPPGGPRLFFGVRKTLGIIFNYLILWVRVRVKVLGSVNSYHNHNPKHIYNPNPNPTLTKWPNPNHNPNPQS